VLEAENGQTALTVLEEKYQAAAYRTKKQQKERQRKQKMQFMESASTSEQRLWRHCL
jgi:hypothetical protein